MLVSLAAFFFLGQSAPADTFAAYRAAAEKLDSAGYSTVRAWSAYYHVPPAERLGSVEPPKEPDGRALPVPAGLYADSTYLDYCVVVKGVSADGLKGLATANAGPVPSGPADPALARVLAELNEAAEETAFAEFASGQSAAGTNYLLDALAANRRWMQAGKEAANASLADDSGLFEAFAQALPGMAEADLVKADDACARLVKTPGQNQVESGDLGAARTVDAVRFRLLRVEVALQRFEREYRQFPKKLEELNRNDLILDPLTGKTFQYEAIPFSGYRLFSAGGSAVLRISLDGGEAR